MGYYKRKMFSKIIEYLYTPEIIVVHGARQVGKTTLLNMTMEHLRSKDIPSSNIIFFDLEDFTLLDLCNQGYGEVYKYILSKSINNDSKVVLFIDEIQYLDNPSSFLKLMHDRYNDQIKLIVSGSSSFEIKSKFKDSLVGRTVNFELFPLRFSEYLDFRGFNVNLLSNLPDIIHNELSKLYEEYVVYGGYPKLALESQEERKEKYLKQIISTYVKKDLVDIARIRELQKYNKLLRMLASQTGSLVNVNELSNTLGISRQTIEYYLFIMENTYVIKNLTPFYNNIRSELTKTSKVFWEDSGLAGLLHYDHFVHEISGSGFENSVYSELRKSDLITSIQFWRTTNKQEVDFIIRVKGKIIPLEVKLNYSGRRISALNYFMKKYLIPEGMVVTLNKTVKETEGSGLVVLYPWEIEPYLLSL